MNARHDSVDLFSVSTLERYWTAALKSLRARLESDLETEKLDHNRSTESDQDQPDSDERHRDGALQK
jgi:hypothetical protein